MDHDCRDTLVMDETGVQELPDAIRKVCQASGIFLTIEVPGLGRALVIPEQSLGDLIGLFKSADFAATLERGVGDVARARGVTRPSGAAPGDEVLPLRETDIADSIERGCADFANARGTVRPAGEFPR